MQIYVIISQYLQKRKVAIAKLQHFKPLRQIRYNEKDSNFREFKICFIFSIINVFFYLRNLDLKKSLEFLFGLQPNS